MASSSCTLLLPPLALSYISHKSPPPHRHLFLPHLHHRRLRSLQLARGQNRRGGGDSADPPDRLISAACYLYPFLDGVHFGRFLLAQFPPLQLVILPLTPAIRLFRASPLNPFLIFLTLYFAVVRNPSSFSRYVRFNTMQAIVLDVLLIFPDLIERTFAPRDGVGLDIVMSIDSTVFLFLLVSLVYGSTTCLLGQVPRLPIVAEAADKQVFEEEAPHGPLYIFCNIRHAGTCPTSALLQEWILHAAATISPCPCAIGGHDHSPSGCGSLPTFVLS